MANLGTYYEIIEKDDEEAKKYYMMGIEKGHWVSTFNMCSFCVRNNKKDYESMKKYCMISIEKGCVKAMLLLGAHYEDIEKDDELAKKYYTMASEKGSIKTMNIFNED
jgi:TPR repeat protein